VKYPYNHWVFDPDYSAPTLRAQVEKAEPPGSVTNLWLVDGMVRNLTVRECLRVMGFPADALEGVDEPTAFGVVGDSVCQPVARALLREVIRMLS